MEMINKKNKLKGVSFFYCEDHKSALNKRVDYSISLSSANNLIFKVCIFGCLY